MSRTATATRSGPGYTLPEFLRANWTLVDLTNEEAARELHLKAGGVVSQWKSGKSRVPVERLPALARIMKLDLSVLLPLWLEQYAPGTPRSKLSARAYAAISDVLDRLTAPSEWRALRAVRNGLGSRPRAFSQEELDAFELLGAYPRLATAVVRRHRLGGI